MVVMLWRMKDDLEAIELAICRDRHVADICRRIRYATGVTIQMMALFNIFAIFGGTHWRYEIATEMRFR